MTREEAIRRMEICRDFLANNYSDMGEPNFTAFNMAIKALSQEPILDKIRDEIEAEPYVSKYECFHCGHKAVIWDNDYDLEEEGYIGRGLVHLCHCTNCGAEIEYRIMESDETESEI